MGGGTRLKVLEAIAMEIPVVTTTVGCEGIAVADRESVLVADTPRRFADAVIELIRDRRLARALVKKGSELVKTRYEWSVIGNHLAEVQSRIVNASSGRNVRYRLSSPGVAAQV
jgi:glycosyltransferase involved in cell wall biosynthesis